MLRNNKHIKKSTLILLALSLTMIFALILITQAKAEATATIWTDKADYTPEQIVTIYGTTFTPNTPITVNVTRPDGTTTSSLDGLTGPYAVTITYQSDGTTDQNGNFTAKYQLDGIMGTYNVTATDGTNTATTTFTDAPQKDVYITTTAGGSVTAKCVKQANSTTITVAASIKNYHFSVNSGTTITFTANASSSYSFTGWSGDLTGTTNPQTVTVDNKKNVTATFTIITYTVTFTESNLPTGTTWKVTLNSVLHSSTTNTITFTGITTGNYSWNASTPITGGTGTQYVASSSSGTINVPTQTSQTINYDTYYWVQYAANAPVSVPSSEWIKSGNTATGNFSSPQYNLANDTKYVFVSDNRPETITAPTTITATFDIYYRVEYTSNVPASTPTSEWVKSGDGATGVFSTPQYNLAGDTKYVYVSDDRPLTITAPTTITATYDTLFWVQYAANVPVSIPSSEWVKSGETATGAFSSPQYSPDGNTKYVYVSDDRPLTITSPTTITATYGNYFNVHYAANVPATVPADEWVKSGDAATGEFSSPQYNLANDTKYLFVSDDRPSTISAPTTITATYDTYYCVVYAANVPVSLPASEWVKSGDSSTGNFSSPQYNLEGDTKYVFVSDDRPATITAPTTITATYDTYYNVHYAANVPVTVPTDEWIKSGDAATGEFSSPQYNGVGDVKYVFVSDDRPDTITAPTTITAKYDTYYWVDYTANVSVSVPSSEWVKSGESATGAFSSPQYNLAGDIKYVYVNDNRTLTITAPITITANYSTYFWVQYALSGNENSVTLPSSEWVIDSGLATGSFPSVVEVGGVKDVLVNVVPSLSAAITSPTTIMAYYDTYYWLTVNTNPVSGIGEPSSPTGQGWYEHGATANVTAAQVVNITIGSRYDFRNWTGASLTGNADNEASVIMNEPETATANYQLQYLVTFAQDGVGVDYTGTVVFVDGFGLGTSVLPKSYWWDANSLHSFAFPTYLNVSSTERYEYYETLGLSTLQSNNNLTISASGTITGYFGVEYLVTFDQSGINSDFSGTVVIVDGVNYTKGSLPVSLWLESEETHSFAFQSPLAVGTNKQYVWNSTSGLSTLQSNSSLTVSQAGPLTGNYYSAVLTYNGGISGQYSDPVTVNATLTKSAGSVSGVTVTFTIGTQSATATTNNLGVASTTIILTQPSGNYTVTASCAGASGTTLKDSKSFHINKETLDITYTGDIFDVTNGANSWSVNFSADLVQQDDGYPGDLTRANVTFAVFKSSNLGSTPDYQFKVSSTAAGLAQIYGTLAPDVYTIYVRLNPGNNTYWQANQVPVVVLTVTISSTGSVTGGGWIPDSMSSNGKGNFGFTVQYNKNQAPKGSFVYVYRGLDGFTYVVKSNSWQAGYLAFTATNKAYFTGKCVIQKIDPSNGALVASWGNSKFSVYITDNDQGSNQSTSTDTIAISFSTPTYVDSYTTRTIGTADSQITLGRGNIVIHKSK